MVGMSGVGSGHGLVSWFGQASGRWSWECARIARVISRRFGLLGWVALACVVVAALAAIQAQRARTQLDDVRRQVAELNVVAARPVETQGQAPTRLSAFEDILLVHADIPATVQDILELAQTQHLSIARGDYRPQIDARGGFMRYRMALPVKGDAQAIHRFMLAALRAHRTLALESAQFKRDRIESSEVEARIQWVVMTRLPSADAASAKEGAVQGGAAKSSDQKGRTP